MRRVSITLGVLAALVATAAHAQTCMPSSTVLCLNQGRFQVTATWDGADQATFATPATPIDGDGVTVDLGFDDSGAFGFLDAATPDLLVKVLDGRDINGHWWVFAAAATDLGMLLKVEDLQGGGSAQYRNPPGRPFVSVADTAAFEDAGRAPALPSSSPLVSRGGCGPPSLCLDLPRWSVDVSWTDFAGGEGTATGVTFDPQSGFLWLFSDTNLEMVVRVVDGRSVDGSFWFGAAAATNVQLSVTLTDLDTGRRRTWHNPLGQPFTTILDRDPFGRPGDTRWISSLGAARVAGLAGSDWHDRQLFRAGPDGSGFDLILTPRGDAFDADGDPRLRVDLQPDETLVLDDVHAELLPGVAGAGTLRLDVDPGSAPPLWRSYVYNLSDFGEFGMVTRPFLPVVDGWHHAGTTLGTVLSPAGFRDNLDPTAGPDGMVGTWLYANAAGGNPVEIAASYPANTTVQLSVSSLLGFQPEPAASLSFRVDAGAGRVFLSRNNDGSNDPARDEMEPLR